MIDDDGKMLRACAWVALVALLVGGAVTFVRAINVLTDKLEERAQRRAKFLRDCEADGRKDYECQVLWGQANP